MIDLKPRKMMDTKHKYFNPKQMTWHKYFSTKNNDPNSSRISDINNSHKMTMEYWWILSINISPSLITWLWTTSRIDKKQNYFSDFVEVYGIVCCSVALVYRDMRKKTELLSMYYLFSLSLLCPLLTNVHQDYKVLQHAEEKLS